MNAKNSLYFTFCLLTALLYQSCLTDSPLDSPITLDCAYDSSITLTNHNENGVDYIVDCQVEISAGTMSIAEGTIIEFRPGTGLSVTFDGILQAGGSSGNPVIMRGTSSGDPSWRGVFINSSQANNTFNHVEIHDAGDGESYSLFEDVTAAITFQGRFSMRNSLISNSGGAGIFSEESLVQSDVSYFADNRIESCNSFPIFINMDLSHDFDFSSLSFDQNGQEMIAFHAFHYDRLTKDLSLEPADIPYFIDSRLDLYAGLTLEAGVEMLMGNNAEIMITSAENPYLKVQGTQSNHVTIRGRESTNKYWKGIYINGANGNNLWEYLDLSDGGSEPLGFTSSGANVALEFSGSLEMTNCTSARSGSSCDIIVSSFGGASTLINDSNDIDICNE